MRSIEARYEDGVLRPEGPVGLRPGERVRLIVVREADPARWNLQRLAAGAELDETMAREGLDWWAEELDHEDHR
ncbi:MAG: antitoxin family protein [Deltaproteobacteria bacterium]|nr:antitoxin family protein [Deltaproteobacteria bacterium]